MNKTELVKKISDKLESSQKEAEKMISCFMETITETLQQNEEISIRGFGTFALRQSKERQSLHPKTRQPITIPASQIPYFKISKNFKKNFKDKNINL